MDKETGRFFVAVILPDIVKEEIFHVQRELSNQTVHYRWVQKELLHLTLIFCGEQIVENMMDFASILAERVRTFSSFTFSLGGIGAFPTINNPRVIWLGITDGETQLVSLQKLVSDTYFECRLSTPDTKNTFHPHITLARMKKGQNPKNDPLSVKSKLPIVENIVPVEAIFLMESRLSFQGPQYRIVKSFRLQK